MAYPHEIWKWLLDQHRADHEDFSLRRPDRPSRLVDPKRHQERYLSCICQPEAGSIYIEMFIRIERMSDLMRIK